MIRTILSSAFVVMAIPASLLAANQTSTVSPVTVGGSLPYRVDLRVHDMGAAEMPTLHSFVAGEYDGQWVVLAGLSNGLHGFDIDQTSIPDRKQNADVWVIDPVAKTSWRRSLLSDSPDSGLTATQVLSVTTANSEFEQVGDKLYMVGGYGDNDPNAPESRGTFDTLTSFDLPGLVGWAKGGAGLAADHMRQVSDPSFAVTGGDMYAIDGQMHLVFGQDYQGRYRGGLNGEYTKQVRSFTIQDDASGLSFTSTGASTPADEFRRRDLNVFPTLAKQGDGSLEQGLTVLSGVFTDTNGAWTVPVEIDANGVPTQLDNGADPLNAGGALDADGSVFKQAMNNYHSAKLGLFSAATGDMHELLFGGITLQEYDPGSAEADANGFVTDLGLPNTNQISAVVRRDGGSYEQHLMGEFPELLSGGGDRLRFGSNAEFFPAEGIDLFDNGVISLDALSGQTTVGYIFGGITANAPHVFSNPTGLSAASGLVFEVVLTVVPEPSAGLLLAGLLMGVAARRRAR